MDAYEEKKAELEALGAKVYAAAVDDKEHAEEMAGRGLTFSIGYGVTKEQADSIGAWWSDDRDGFVQPTEFLIGRGGVVLGSMYASGPVGRMGADEAIRLINNRERRRLEEEQQSAGT